MKHSTMYLYGIAASDLADMRYEDALHAKIKGARQVMKDASAFARTQLDNQTAYDATKERYIHAEKAVDFNLALLQEMIQ